MTSRQVVGVERKTAHEKRLHLRALLDEPRVVFAPSCGDAFGARLIEWIGIEAVHCSGSSLHRRAGFADAGLLTLSEMASALARICDAVDIPVIADADTGFGGVANVARTVREYERAGAAAMHLEDQLTPKRPPVLGGPGDETISRTEMVNKIRAAVDAREDESFVIIARSEVKGDPDEVIERLEACIEAGADAGWLSGSYGAEDTLRLRRTITKPLVGALPAQMSLREYEELGANCALLPTWLDTVAAQAQRDLLVQYVRTGRGDDYVERLGDLSEVREFVQRIGQAELDDIERRFG
jgi:2-methylisocitrate lyase-like PEP mutase family enzyme